jgi:aryl-alcohol dehydrogenase-like predicted oxidoreductase
MSSGSPLTSVSNIVEAHQVGVRQIALAWLLHHADNILPRGAGMRRTRSGLVDAR